MITKDQAIKLGEWGDNSEIHYTGKHDCTRAIGPKGGIKESVVKVRASGKCQVWKRDTERFRLPIKYGMYESWEITQANAGDFHLWDYCPLNDTEGEVLPEPRAPLTAQSTLSEGYAATAALIALIKASK